MSNQFATIKVRSQFLAWIKREAARRGIFMFQVLEESVAASFGGKKPWEMNKAITRAQRAVQKRKISSSHHSHVFLTFAPLGGDDALPDADRVRSR